MACRGLLLDEHGAVVGRGFSKFFEPEPYDLIPRGRPFMAYDKMDGTLIHCTVWNGQLVLWTKAGFDSRFVDPATEHLKGWTPTDGCTALFEAIFPWNRIVVDYGSFDGLVLLAQVHNETGADTGTPDEIAETTGWFGEIVRPRNIPLSDLISIVRNPDNGDNREGFVLVFPEDGKPSLRFKMKFGTYKHLHKTLSSLTARSVHETLLKAHEEGGGIWTSFISPLPDDLKQFVLSVVDDITNTAGEMYGNAERAVNGTRDLESRREIAHVLQQVEPSVRAIAWLLLDGRESEAMTLALRAARPASTTAI